MQFEHRHVVKYFRFKEDGIYQKGDESYEVAYIVQELISGGSLFDYIANSGKFSEAICKYYFKQILQGLHYIH